MTGDGMMEIRKKVGIISCSGEEIPEGTISRNAVRCVLEALRPGWTVTLCLPLFLAGGEEERSFARNHPVIAVDGCGKLCAKRGTEMHSGPVSASLVVTDMLEGYSTEYSRSSKIITEQDAAAVMLVAGQIATKVDSLLDGIPAEDLTGIREEEPGCACSRPLPGLSLTVAGKNVTIDGLSLIFGQLAEEGTAAGAASAGVILERVKIYHSIPAHEEIEYRAALSDAYLEFRRKQS